MIILKSRQFYRHFGELSILKTDQHSELAHFAMHTAEECMARLHTSIKGLNEFEVSNRLLENGLNEIETDKSPAFFFQLANAFITPFNGVLIAVVLVAFVADIWLLNVDKRDYKTVIMVSMMILLSSVIRFWQEYRSNKAALQLKNMISTTAQLIREETGSTEAIPDGGQGRSSGVRP